jgi:hypothetical protein
MLFHDPRTECLNLKLNMKGYNGVAGMLRPG